MYTFSFEWESVLQLKFSGLEFTFRVNFLSWAVLIVLDISLPDNVFWYKETVVPLSMGLDFTNLMIFSFDSSLVIFRFMGAHQALWSKVINLAKFPALSCLGTNKVLLIINWPILRRKLISLQKREWWLNGISTPDFSTPSFDPRPFNPWLFNNELSNLGLFNHEPSNPGFVNSRLGAEKSRVEKSGVEKFMVQKSGVGRSRVKAWGWKLPRVEISFNQFYY